MRKRKFHKKLMLILICTVGVYIIVSCISNNISTAILSQFILPLTYYIINDNTVSFSLCEQKYVGLAWWNSTFNQQWIDICHKDPYSLQEFPTSSMKCSTSDDSKLQMCIAQNVYASRDKHGLLQFHLRCDLDETYWRESEMDDNTPNINTLQDEFYSMNTNNTNNFTYLNSFTTQNNSTAVYYYSNSFANWCVSSLSSDNDYRGNPWRCLSFILQIVGMKLTFDDTMHPQTPSVYITGSKASKLKQSGTYDMIHDIIAPLYDDIIFQPISNDAKHKYFFPELRIMPSSAHSVIWNFAENYRKCPPHNARSPLVKKLKDYYMDYYHEELADNNLFVKILNNDHFNIYYNHAQVHRSNAELIQLLSNMFRNNNNGDIDIIYFDNNWFGSQCATHCIVNHKSMITNTVKQSAGIIIDGNALYLEFVIQIFLYSNIKYYIGMHGSGFALTMFMNPKMVNRDYMIFEITNVDNRKRRNVEQFALYSGMCYAKMVVKQESFGEALNVDRVDPQEMYSTFQKAKEKCNAPTLV